MEILSTATSSTETSKVEMAQAAVSDDSEIQPQGVEAELSQDDPKSALPDASSESFRSRQQTLAMGGNVNYRERMPSLREMAEEFIEHAPPPTREPEPAPAPEEEEERMTDVALRMVSEVPKPGVAAGGGLSKPPPAPAPPPRPDPIPVPAAGTLADVAPVAAAGSARESTALPVGEVSPSPQIWETPPPSAAEPLVPEAQRVYGESAFPQAGGSERATEPGPPVVSVPFATPETLSAQLLSGPAEPVAEEVLGEGSVVARLRRDWSPVNGRHRWQSLGLITALALGGGYWVGAGWFQGDVEAVTQEAAATAASTDEGPSPEAVGASSAATQAQSPTDEPNKAAAAVPENGELALAKGAPDSPSEATAVENGARDEHLAVRKPQQAESCEAVLGEPFMAQPKAHAGKGGAFWSRSRKVLMRGKAQSALKLMCQSASWDLAGRGTYGLSEYYFKNADFDQALQWAKRVPEGSKRYGDARTMIGDVYNQLGLSERALDAYLSYWKLDAAETDKRAELASRFVNSATLARRKGDWWTAERFFRRALVLDADNAVAAGGVARAFAHFELHEAAVHWAERSLELDAKSTQGALALCETWIARGDKNEAEKALRRFQKVAPGHPGTRLLIRQVGKLE